MRWFPIAALILTTLLPGSGTAQPLGAENPVWQLQNSNSTASFRGVHAVGGGVAWVSGTKGTVLRTEDGGYLWQTCSIPQGAENLDFRGIWAWDADNAIVMSSGPGDQSRIYKTSDGCHSWVLLVTNREKEGFWDGIQFSDRQHGVVLGDPVRDHFVVGVTQDGGKSWDFSAAAGPKIDPGSQAAFAASNTSLGISGAMSGLHFATGGKGGAKIYLLQNLPTERNQARWEVFSIPLASGTESAGVFSLATREDGNGVAVGGDYKSPNSSQGTAAWTHDGGRHWESASQPPHGYRSAVAWEEQHKAWIAVGTNGTDVSYDEGRTWLPLDKENWNALSLPWVVGPNGQIGKLISLKGKPTAAR